MFKSMLYFKWKDELRGSDFPCKIDFATSCSIFLLAIRIQTPLSSSPLLPAHPLIWMYSPPVSHLCSSPSNFSRFVNITVLAGMLIPIEKVSVVKRTFIKDIWNRISVTSFAIGKSPPWWTPIPFKSNGKRPLICGNSWSSWLKLWIALLKTYLIVSFSSSFVYSHLERIQAKFSHSDFEKEKQIVGPKFFEITRLITPLSSVVSVFFLVFFPFDSTICIRSLSPSILDTAWVKFSSLNLEVLSTTRYNSSVPLGWM